ncbi:MAG TPA: hypothetical protein VE075_06120, partial [Thermoanaerobaculia bacterium]|nr:hypothetical protein [Thermoanaerobaculia bacterium]
STKMKKALHVRLTLVSTAAAALVASGCGRPAAGGDPVGDPCAPETFQEVDCREAIAHQGYYRHGVFVPHVYYRTYNDYAYDEWQRQRQQQAGAAAPEAVHGVAREPDEVSRGGFGETGEMARGGGIGE